MPTRAAALLRRSGLLAARAAGAVSAQPPRRDELENNAAGALSSPRVVLRGPRGGVCRGWVRGDEGNCAVMLEVGCRSGSRSAWLDPWRELLRFPRFSWAAGFSLAGNVRGGGAAVLLGSNPGIICCSRRRVSSLSMAASSGRSSGETSEIASPELPARPVRPMRCT